MLLSEGFARGNRSAGDLSRIFSRLAHSASIAVPLCRGIWRTGYGLPPGPDQPQAYLATRDA